MKTPDQRTPGITIAATSVPLHRRFFVVFGVPLRLLSGRSQKQNGATADAANVNAIRCIAIGCAFLLGAVGSMSSPALAATNGSGPTFDPANFGEPAGGANRWLPLRTGYQSVRQGSLNRGHRRLTHRRVYTVTDVTKEINGVRTVVVLDQDIDGNEIAEQALDYLAQDKQGNVWYLGSYTESYEGGQFVNVNDAWLAGVRGGRAGILMLAAPGVASPSYTQGYVPGEGATTARVSKVGQKKCVPFKCYADVLVIVEGGENVFYAPGVGAIKTEPRRAGGENETEELVNLTQLSSAGLSELSAETLKLDEHARTTSGRVFGTSAPAKRIG